MPEHKLHNLLFYWWPNTTTNYGPLVRYVSRLEYSFRAWFWIYSRISKLPPKCTTQILSLLEHSSHKSRFFTVVATTLMETTFITVPWTWPHFGSQHETIGWVIHQTTGRETLLQPHYSFFFLFLSPKRYCCLITEFFFLFFFPSSKMTSARDVTYETAVLLMIIMYSYVL